MVGRGCAVFPYIEGILGRESVLKGYEGKVDGAVLVGYEVGWKPLKGE